MLQHQHSIQERFFFRSKMVSVHCPWISIVSFCVLLFLIAIEIILQQESDERSEQQFDKFSWGIPRISPAHAITWTLSPTGFPIIRSLIRSAYVRTYMRIPIHGTGSTRSGSTTDGTCFDRFMYAGASNAAASSKNWPPRKSCAYLSHFSFCNTPHRVLRPFWPTLCFCYVVKKRTFFFHVSMHTNKSNRYRRIQLLSHPTLWRSLRTFYHSTCVHLSSGDNQPTRLSGYTSHDDWGEHQEEIDRKFLMREQRSNPSKSARSRCAALWYPTDPTPGYALLYTCVHAEEGTYSFKVRTHACLLCRYTHTCFSVLPHNGLRLCAICVSKQVDFFLLPPVRFFLCFCFCC